MSDISVDGDAWASSGWIARADETTTRQRLSAEVLDGPAAYCALEADWLRLAALQRGACVFQTPDILECWSRNFATRASSRLVTIVVRAADGRAVLIWPLVVERNALLRIAKAAGSPVGQYDEMLLDPTCDAAAAWKVAKAALMRDVRPDLLLLERVRSDGAMYAAIGAVAPLASSEAAPYADLSSGFDEFMAGLKPRVKRQQKGRARRFQELGEVRFEVASEPELAEAWLAEAVELKREWLRATGRFSRAFLKTETVACLLACARTLAAPTASPRMVVSRLSLDGRTAAIEAGFCHRGTYHLYLGAFAADLAKASPGNISTEKLLHWCVENGITRYDMLAPRSQFKSDWQSGEVAVHDFAVPMTLRGRAYEWGVLRQALPAMRNLFYALPAGLRSRLAGPQFRQVGGYEPPRRPHAVADTPRDGLTPLRASSAGSSRRSCIETPRAGWDGRGAWRPETSARLHGTLIG